MKTLLKFTSFCLIFLSFSQVGFGQIDSTNTHKKVSGKISYADTTLWSNYTVLESKNTKNGAINKVKNNKTGEESTLTEIFPSFKDVTLLNISNKIKYPKEAIINNISGTVVTQFTITEKGELTNVKILKGAHESLNKEALRVINSIPLWSPAKLNGEPESVNVIMPFGFRVL